MVVNSIASIRIAIWMLIVHPTLVFIQSRCEARTRTIMFLIRDAVIMNRLPLMDHFIIRKKQTNKQHLVLFEIKF